MIQTGAIEVTNKPPRLIRSTIANCLCCGRSRTRHLIIDIEYPCAIVGFADDSTTIIDVRQIRIANADIRNLRT